MSIDAFEKFDRYIKQLRKPFTKICRLRFLNSDGSVAFVVDNNFRNERNNVFSINGGKVKKTNRNSTAFISEGTISVNLQNGQRRTVDITLSNVDEIFDYNVNNIWFGQEIALDEGLILDDGSDYYIQQGIFLIKEPTENVSNGQRTIQYTLVDKWAYIDGSLGGYLTSSYEIPAGTNIFEPISALLLEDRGNGIPIDRIPPVYTNYYNDKTQELPDGSTASLIVSPYDLKLDSVDDTIANIIIKLVEMINGIVGYDSSGALRIDASQDDIIDSTKPITWEFGTDEVTLSQMTYTSKNTDVYNDVIVIGEELNDYSQPNGRAQNFDPLSDTNINIIGRKTKRISQSGFATNTQCKDFANWTLKKASIMQKSVSITSTQIMHIDENKIVTIRRTDKEGSPIERHLVQGFSRPLSGNGSMTIDAVSVNDIAIATITSDE